MKIVVDTNIFIAALIKDGMARHLLTHLNVDLVTIGFSSQELNKYRSYILKKAKIDSETLDQIIYTLFEKITVIPDPLIQLFFHKAQSIMDKIDPKDSPFIAAALAIEADIWSDDIHFQKQSKVKVWTTSELLRWHLDQE